MAINPVISMVSVVFYHRLVMFRRESRIYVPDIDPLTRGLKAR